VHAELPASVARVAAAAAARGLTIDVRAFPEGTRTAEDAARAVGCHVGQIVKSLVFVAGERPVLALVAGSNRLDEAKLAAVAGAGSVRRASAEEVRAATSYAVGGVPPFGHPAPIPTWVDHDLLVHERVWVAAGTPHHVFALTPADLVSATGAEPADLKSAPAEPAS
jgi:prolyl-tRNA editing enzyme YbaK/EbsC (Cys-tRNA(Pro) deacylase)